MIKQGSSSFAVDRPGLSSRSGHGIIMESEEVDERNWQAGLNQPASDNTVQS